MSRPGALPRHLRMLVILALAALVLLPGTPAEAKRGRRPARRPATTTRIVPAPASTAPGMVIAIDPETGRLGVPSAEQMLELSAAERTGLLRTAEGLTEVQLPDGSVMVDLQGRFQMFTVLRLDAQGQPQFVPVEDEPAMLHALTAPAPTRTPEER